MEVTKSDDKLPIKMTSYIFTQLLIALGCTRPSDLEMEFTQEFKKIEEIWLCLLQSSTVAKGSKTKEIQVCDAKIFLMAIFGVRGHRRLGVEDTGQIEKQ